MWGRSMSALRAMSRRWTEPDQSNPWVPVAETARYEPPRARIDPDPSRSWLARAMPIVMSHKVTFITAMGTSFLALILQVQIPNVLGDAVTHSIVARNVLP